MIGRWKMEDGRWKKTLFAAAFSTPTSTFYLLPSKVTGGND